MGFKAELPPASRVSGREATTRDSIRARVWDAAPAPTGLDVTADVRAMRAEDFALADANAAARSAQSPVEGAGDALLAYLGLV
jgi:hypothetical protein